MDHEMPDPKDFDQDTYDRACELANVVGREEEAAELYRQVGCDEEAELAEERAGRYEAG